MPENGSNSFTISLDTVPSEPVEIGLGTTADACMVMEPSVTLTPVDIRQTVTVLGNHDLQFASDRPCGVSTAISTAISRSADPNYDRVDPDDVSVSVLDTTTAGVQAFPTSRLVTDEAGGSDTFEIVLTAIPTANVTVELKGSDAGAGTPSTNVVTFTRGNTFVEQTIPVTGQPDGVIDPNIVFQIGIGPVTSAGSRFDDLPADDVSIVNLDVDDFVFIDGFKEGQLAGNADRRRTIERGLVPLIAMLYTAMPSCRREFRIHVPHRPVHPFRRLLPRRTGTAVSLIRPES